MIKLNKLCSVIFLSLVMLSGCNQNADTSYQEQESGNTIFVGERPSDAREVQPRNVTNGGNSPDFVNLSGDRVNQNGEIEKARKVIETTGDYIPDSVWINGTDMWITVHKKGQLSQREKINAEAQLHNKLVKAIPNYDINVKVQDGRS